MTRTLAFSFCVVAASFGATAAAPRQMMAAVVVKGKVTIVDAAKRVAVTIDVPEFTAEDADLSPNQKVVAVTGRYKGQTRSRLYLLDATSHALTNVPTEAIGDHRAPRYLSDGSGFVFVAGLKDAVGGPDNPSRLHRYFQSTGKVVRVETKKNSCEFSPVVLGLDEVISVSTHCFIGYEILATSLKSGKTRTVGSATGAWNELAASPNGKRVVYHAETPNGMAFYVMEGSQKKPRLLATVPALEMRAQPRFVSDSDVLFLSGDAFWVLDSTSGRTQQIIAPGATASEVKQ